MKNKTIGIVAHSYEGGALCYQSVCREGIKGLDQDLHPNSRVEYIPMGLSMPAWESGDYAEVGKSSFRRHRASR